MKIILLLLLMYASNNVYAGPNDALPIKILRPDSITATGKPTGVVTSREIDKSRGKIVSDD